MKTTQTFDKLPADAYYVSNAKYSGLSNKENFERNNSVRLGDIARINKLK